MREGNRWRLGVVLVLALVSACAPRTAPPVVTAPRHPDFIIPAVPEGASEALRAGIQRGWQYLQAGDVGNAEREFNAALKASPQSPSAEAALGYAALARGRADNAVPFYHALAAQADGTYPSWNFHKYLVGRDGKVAASFGSRTPPDDAAMLAAIEAELARAAPESP